MTALEPYAIHFKKNPDSTGAEYLPVTQGRRAGGIQLAWIPTASLTIMMTVRNAPNNGSFLRLFHKDHSYRHLLTVRSGETNYTVTVAAEPGDYLRFYSAAVPADTVVEALLNVVPLPYSQ